MSAIAEAVSDVTNAEEEKFAGVILEGAGFKAYVRRLPTPEDREALRASVKSLPKAQRKGHLIAAASCYPTGFDIPADHEAAYAARLAKAKPAELDRLFKVACHLNGTTPQEMLAE